MKIKFLVSCKAKIYSLYLINVNLSYIADYFASVLMFKTLQGTGFHYLSEDLTYTHQYHSYNTRAASNNILILNKPNCEIFKTSMRYYGINLWNSLSNSFKSCQSVNEFKYVYKNILTSHNNARDNSQHFN